MKLIDTSNKPIILNFGMNKNLKEILSAFEEKDFFTIAEARRLPALSSLSDSGVCNLLNEELSRPNSRIGKISYGLYGIKKEIPGTGIFDTASGLDYLIAKYLGNGKKAKGYITGLSFLNIIGYSDDVPARLELASNLEKSRGREILVSNQRAYLRKPSSPVNSKNARILPVFDVLSRGSSNKDPKLMEDCCHYLVSLGVHAEEVERIFNRLPKGSKRRIDIGGLLHGIMGR
jgi:hypothetical protein